MQLPRRRSLITEILAEEGIQDILVNQDRTAGLSYCQIDGFRALDLDVKASSIDRKGRLAPGILDSLKVFKLCASCSTHKEMLTITSDDHSAVVGDLDTIDLLAGLEGGGALDLLVPQCVDRNLSFSILLRDDRAGNSSCASFFSHRG